MTRMYIPRRKGGVIVSYRLDTADNNKVILTGAHLLHSNRCRKLNLVTMSDKNYNQLEMVVTKGEKYVRAH